jgi:phosphoribosylformimino-5-aminoimidazole carboxamide ribotide isomerase
MIAIPAIDLREGACVQLVGGRYAAERIRIADPLSVARQWVTAGFSRLHLVDLDAATAAGHNRSMVTRVLSQSPVPVQVGGGVRSVDDIARLLDGGADRVVVGTRAVTDRRWLVEITAGFPGRIVVAADVRDRRVVVDGWSRSLPLEPVDYVTGLRGLGLGGLLVTAVHREGRERGTDLPLMRAVVEAADVPVQAAGGIASMHELRALARDGCAAAVLGMALYTGSLEPREVAEEFGQ